ncbi:MAG TPA: hypothetical protein ENO21_00985 [Firmicutes bacterium]|nr:hypothetical protein [Bacillota bacterium]
MGNPGLQTVRWTAAGFVLALLLCTAGCNSNYRARVEGDTVYMPQASSMLRYERSTSEPLPFVLFDGQYPREWPDAVRLPEDSYLRIEGSLVGKRNTYGFLADFDGVCRGTPERVAEDWKQRIENDGWTFTYSEPDVRKSYPAGMADNYFRIFAQQPGTFGDSRAEVIVYQHSHMDGWVHFSGYLMVDSY